jgi:hypothetical protein
MRWDLTQVYSADPGQLDGAAMATNARTYEYAATPGTQLVLIAMWQKGTGTTITRVRLAPEFSLQTNTGLLFPAAELFPAAVLGGTTLFAAPVSYRVGADDGDGAVAGTPISPLTLRYDALDVPTDIMNAGQGAGIVSAIFYYPALCQRVRFRLVLDNGPGSAGATHDIFQLYLLRGTIKGGVATGAGQAGA